jgi:hypothetical protein
MMPNHDLDRLIRESREKIGIMNQDSSLSKIMNLGTTPSLLLNFDYSSIFDSKDALQ